MYKILLIGNLLLSGCASHYWVANYDGFIKVANSHIGSEIRNAIGKEDDIKSLNEKENMYIYTDMTGCKFGYIVNRDDPDKIIKSWVVLENKEKCKTHIPWFG